MADKKAFLLYHDNFEIIEELSDEQAGKLLKAMFDFSVNGVDFSTDDGMLRIVWKQMKNTLSRDIEKYEKASEEKSRKARLGGIIKQLQDGNRVSKESIEFLSNTNIGQAYLVSKQVPREMIDYVWHEMKNFEQIKNLKENPITETTTAALEELQEKINKRREECD